MKSSTQTTTFRGVYAIPPTPFTASGAVDEASLQNCVDFCVEGGAGGIVAPVNASESIVLTDEERMRVAEILVSQAARRVPVVVGVSSISTESSVLFARHAARIGADAVIAMPPYVRHPPSDEIFDFYAAVAAAADGLPVWIQDYVAPVGTPMSVGLLLRLLTIPGVEWLKEETQYAPQVMSDVTRQADGRLKGMMGGMAGRYLVEEFRRGACGTMPACEVVDAHAKVWAALELGDMDEARRLHACLLPLLNYEAMYSFTVYKEVLCRRGVIANPRTRVPGAGKLDAENQRELDLLLKEIEPLLTLGMVWRGGSRRPSVQ